MFWVQNLVAPNRTIEYFLPSSVLLFILMINQFYYPNGEIIAQFNTAFVFIKNKPIFHLHLLPINA
jgi:hypothetical protein